MEPTEGMLKHMTKGMAKWYRGLEDVDHAKLQEGYERFLKHRATSAITYDTWCITMSGVAVVMHRLSPWKQDRLLGRIKSKAKAKGLLLQEDLATWEEEMRKLEAETVDPDEPEEVHDDGPSDAELASQARDEQDRQDAQFYPGGPEDDGRP